MMKMFFVVVLVGVVVVLVFGQIGDEFWDWNFDIFLDG